jgi:hypothetical protein
MRPADAFTAEFMGDCVMLDVAAAPSGPAEEPCGEYSSPAAFRNDSASGTEHVGNIRGGCASPAASQDAAAPARVLPAGLAGFIEDMPLVLDIGACPAPPFTIMLRPDWIETAGERDCPNRFTGIVRESSFAGAYVLYRILALGREMRVKTPALKDGQPRRQGESLEFCFAPDRPVLLG